MINKEYYRGIVLYKCDDFSIILHYLFKLNHEEEFEG